MKIETLQKIKACFTRNEVITSPKQLVKCKKYLYDLPQPNDEIDRSFNQFLTQKYFQHNVFVHFFEKFYAKLNLSKLMHGLNTKSTNFDRTVDAVFFNKLGLDILPDELLIEYPDIVIDDGYDNPMLTNADCDFILEIQSRYRDAFFIYKLIYRIAIYRNLIEKYHPKAIIATSEYSFCSSILTLFCRKNGIKHINVMHGEKLFDMMATFFEFDRCYVWDSSYIDLFLSQRAYDEQFVVSIPKSLRFKSYAVEPSTDLKIYLSNESKSELKRLKRNVDLIKCNSLLDIKRIRIRLHPLYTSLKIFKRIFKQDYEIEDNKAICIEQSILDSKYVMARCSTVLLQAKYNNVQVIIDDCTSPKLSNMLKLLNYRVISMDGIILLSELLK